MLGEEKTKDGRAIAFTKWATLQTYVWSLHSGEKMADSWQGSTTWWEKRTNENGASRGWKREGPWSRPWEKQVEDFYSMWSKMFKDGCFAVVSTGEQNTYSDLLEMQWLFIYTQEADSKTVHEVELVSSQNQPGINSETVKYNMINKEHRRSAFSFSGSLGCMLRVKWSCYLNL